MKVARLKVERYRVIQHHPGVEQPWDVALCGQDLMGDDWLGWGTAEKVEGKVTCPDCARIIHACRQLNREDYVLSSKSVYLD
jgi:hypothetical protein